MSGKGDLQKRGRVKTFLDKQEQGSPLAPDLPVRDARRGPGGSSERMPHSTLNACENTKVRGVGNAWTGTKPSSAGILAAIPAQPEQKWGGSGAGQKPGAPALQRPPLVAEWYPP